MRNKFRLDRALRPGRFGKIAFQVVASGTAAGIVGLTMAHRVGREETALRAVRVVVAGEQLTLPADSASSPDDSPTGPTSNAQTSTEGLGPPQPGLDVVAPEPTTDKRDPRPKPAAPNGTWIAASVTNVVDSDQTRSSAAPA